jgi:hypothetical protein
MLIAIQNVRERERERERERCLGCIKKFSNKGVIRKLAATNMPICASSEVLYHSILKTVKLNSLKVGN